MNKYEVLYILDAKIDDAAKEALCDKFKSAVETAAAPWKTSISGA